MQNKTFQQQRGEAAEDLAALFLINQGLVLIEKNYRCKLGEIDLIFRENTTFIFVEVRFRSNQEYADGITSITPAKQRKFTRAVLCYLRENQLSENTDLRLDVIGVECRQSEPTFEWIKNAIVQ